MKSRDLDFNHPQQHDNVLYNYVICEFGKSITSKKVKARETNIGRLIILYCNKQPVITTSVSSIYRGEVSTSSRTPRLVKLPTYGLGFFFEIKHMD